MGIDRSYRGPIVNKLLKFGGEWWWQPDRAYQAFWILPAPLMKHFALKTKVRFIVPHHNVSSQEEHWYEAWNRTLGNLNWVASAGRDYFAGHWIMPANQGW